MNGRIYRIGAAKPMDSLICPFCVRPIDPNALRYRCPVQGDKPCLEEFHGNGRSAGAECPKGHGLSYLAMCPHSDCRSTLPARYMELPRRFIGLVGPTNSGKSTYLAVLVRELRDYFGNGLELTFIPADTWTSDRYEQRYEALITQRRLPNTTQSAKNDPDTARPLIYVLTATQARSRVLGGGTRSRSVNLVIFDSAGEDTQQIESMQRYMRYLRYAAGIILLVDPLTLRDAEADIANVVPPGTQHHDALAKRVITDTTNQLRIAHEIQGDRGKVPVPVAVAVSKIDELQPSLIDSSPLRRRPVRQDGLDVSDRAEVHEYMRGLFHRWKWRLDTDLENSYARYGLFGFSALGAPAEDNTVAPGGLRPYRVMDPMLWFLQQFGLIPRVREKP